MRKALSIGINYYCLPKDKGQLSGCINDSDTMIGILQDTFNYNSHEICRLRDDRNNMMPTKANILAALRWLTQGATAGDELFFHFSGHGGQVEDKDGDEEGGKDSTLIPCDFMQSGMITDDDLYELVVEPLPAGVRMWVMMDCCHSGTALDLPYKVDIGADGKSMKLARAHIRRGGPPESKAEVVMISGCKDSQTSADVQAGGNQKAAGAMTTAFRNCVNRTITCEDLLLKMRDYLKRHKYEQVPQMSSEQYVQLDAPFVSYAAVPKKSREITFSTPWAPTTSHPTPPTPAPQVFSMSTPPASPMLHAAAPPAMHGPPSPMLHAAAPPMVHPLPSPMMHGQVGHPQSPMMHQAPPMHMGGQYYYQAPGMNAYQQPVQQTQGMHDPARIAQLQAQIAELKRASSPMRSTSPYGW